MAYFSVAEKIKIKTIRSTTVHPTGWLRLKRLKKLSIGVKKEQQEGNILLVRW